jgi:hypothetical protein
MAFPGPYIAPRADIQAWADNADEEAARWLRDYPEASHFGVDDGEIQCWLSDERFGATWLAEMEADAVERNARRVQH